MPIVSKYRKELQRNHPEALRSAQSGQPAEIYLLLGPHVDSGFEDQFTWQPRSVSVGLTAEEALDLATELLADLSVLHMTYPDNHQAEAETEANVLSALRAALNRRKQHPAHHFPGELLEQPLSLQVHGVSIHLEQTARLALTPTDRHALHARLDVLLKSDPEPTAARTMQAAHLALAWVHRHGSLHESVYAWLPDVAPGDELGGLIGAVSPERLRSTHARAKLAFDAGSESAAHSCLTMLALSALLHASDLDDQIFSRPALHLNT